MQLRVALTLEQCWHRVPGGTAVAALELASALDACPEIEPVGVAARHSGPPEAAWEPTIPTEQLPLNRHLLYQSWARFRRPPVERAVGPVDVIHATAVAVPPRTAPLVLTIHDLVWMREPEFFTRWGVRFFRQHLEVAKREADVVICSSEATRRDCETAGFPPDRLRVVPLGVRPPRITPEQVDGVRARFGLRRPYVMWVGTREPRKNLPGLLAAFLDVDRDELDLVLVGPEGWGEEVDMVLTDLRDRVHVLGWVSAADKAALYRGAEMFVFPSLREGFGLPVLEAMAQGTPVVTSRGTATEEFGEESTVLVDPYDPRSIADGMRVVLDDRFRARELGRLGTNVAAVHTWERTAERVVDIYREVAG